MRSTDVPAALLVVLAAACAAGGLHVARRRTLVPDAYDTVVVEKERRYEKHRGLDDVVLWHLDDGGTVQVTDVVDELVPRGARIEKEPGPTLFVTAPGGARTRHELADSDDARGMARVAAPSLLAAAALGLVAMRRRRRAPAR